MRAPTEADLLGELFRCERYLPLFPTGMPLRACLRRQLERQPAKDTHGKLQPLAVWPPTKPFCAGQCPLGRQKLEEARAAHLPAETCLRCGAAQVGAGSAAACPGCAEDEDQVPKGGLGRPPTSSRIWSVEVPDVPLGPPPEKAKAASVAALGGASATMAPPRVKPQPTTAPPTEPAPPAEEDEDMAKEGAKTCSKCGKPLRSDNTRGFCGGPGCKKRKDPAGVVELRGADKADRRAAIVASVARIAPARTRAEKSEPAALRTATLDDLVAKRAAAAATVVEVDAELRRRAEELAEVRGKIESEAAAR